MKIYSRTYSEHYTQIAKALPPLAVPLGKKTCFQIPFPSEGVLEAVIVSQVSTDLVPASATIELLNSALPFPPGNYDILATSADAIEHYRILTTPLVVTPGSAAVMDEADFGRGFRNIDGGWTLNQRYVYLLINPDDLVGPQGPQGPQGGTSEETTWNVTLRCRTDIS